MKLIIYQQLDTSCCYCRTHYIKTEVNINKTKTATIPAEYTNQRRAATNDSLTKEALTVSAACQAPEALAPVLDYVLMIRVSNWKQTELGLESRKDGIPAGCVSCRTRGEVESSASFITHSVIYHLLYLANQERNSLPEEWLRELVWTKIKRV